MLKLLRNLLVNSRLGRWLTSRSYWLSDRICRAEGHTFLVRVDKPLNGHYFQHILYCGRCWKIFGERNVRLYDYDSPGYEASMRIWMASIKTITLDSKTIRKLGENLLKLRFRMQQEPSMFDKIKKELDYDSRVSGIIAKPGPDEISRIIRPGNE